MLWCTLVICLDVSHVVSVVGLKKVHWQVVNLILRYLRGATNVGSVFGRNSGIRSSVIDSLGMSIQIMLVIWL